MRESIRQNLEVLFGKSTGFLHVDVELLLNCNLPTIVVLLGFRVFLD